MIYATLLLLAAVTPSPREEVWEIWTTELTVGQTLLVETEKRTYRAEIVNPRTGETQTTVSIDGKNFSTPAKVYFLGSTAGRHPEMMVNMGRLRTGMRIEFGLGTLAGADRALSAPVKSIHVLGHK